MKIAYLAFSGILDSVFDSQVLGLLSFLRIRGIEVDLYAARGLRSLFDREWVKKNDFVRDILGAAPRQVWDLRYGGNWTTYLAQVSFRRQLNASSVPSLIHCRGNYSAYVAVRTQKNRYPIVTDVRGVVGEEFLATRGFDTSGQSGNRWGKRYRALKSLERISVEEADGVSCVSSALRDHLLQEYRLDPEKVVVFPCCVDTSLFYADEESRQRMREALGIVNKRVFLYVGSTKVWQIPDRIGYAFRCAAEEDDRSHLLVLTPEQDEMGRRLTAAGVSPERASILNVPHNRVSEYVRAADVAFLLREKSLVNEVASPTKFGEYVASGVPVLASRGIGDTEHQIRETQVGWLLDDVRDEDEIRRKIRKLLKDLDGADTDRSRISEIGHALYGWQVHVPTLIDLYERVSGVAMQG